MYLLSTNTTITVTVEEYGVKSTFALAQSLEYDNGCGFPSYAQIAEAVQDERAFFGRDFDGNRTLSLWVKWVEPSPECTQVLDRTEFVFTAVNEPAAADESLTR